MGAFDLPSNDLAFDDARCGAGASGRVESGQQTVQERAPVVVGGVGVLRGEKRPGGPRTGG